MPFQGISLPAQVWGGGDVLKCCLAAFPEHPLRVSKVLCICSEAASGPRCPRCIRMHLARR